MAGISRNWNGKVFETNTGNVSLALKGEDDALKHVAVEEVRGVADPVAIHADGRG